MKKNSIKLKVCGLTKLNQIKELIELKVDFLGFIFYEKSPRYVLNRLNLEQISEINHQGKVGVFVNEDLDKIIEISEKAKLNFIQLHGDETEDFITELREKLNPKIGIMSVIRIGNQTSDELQKTINQQSITINYILFDTDSKAFGGTGKTFDWNILNDIEIPIPYFLSGGISLENVEELKNFVKVNQQENKTLTKLNSPFAIDINSKFEIEAGNKDLGKINELIINLQGFENFEGSKKKSNMNFQNPDKNGYYGDFGGAFIPEMLYPNVAELQKNYIKIIESEEFQTNFRIC